MNSTRKQKVTAHYTGMLAAIFRAGGVDRSGAARFSLHARYGSRGVGTCARRPGPCRGASTLLFYHTEPIDTPVALPRYSGAEIKTQDGSRLRRAYTGAHLSVATALARREAAAATGGVITEKRGPVAGRAIVSPFKGGCGIAADASQRNVLCVLRCQREKVALLSVDASGREGGEPRYAAGKNAGSVCLFLGERCSSPFLLGRAAGGEVFLGQVPLDDLASGFAIAVHVADDRSCG